MLKRPCVACGDPIDKGSRCSDCRPKRSAPATHHPLLSTYRWRKLSKRLRKASPQCETCGSTQQLSVDHVIPITEDESLAFVTENLRILCMSHNGSRQDQCTDEERATVHARIAARKARLARMA